MRPLFDKLGWLVAGALGAVLIASFARVVQGGPLDPPGPVGSTMKTLADLAPSWHQTLNSSGCGSARWTCVLGNQGVLDNETGLVWEKTPLFNGADSWANAETSCTSDPAGGRYGWRLPAAAELLTLKDSNTLDLVAGNPFSGVANHNFWSATAAPGDDQSARYISFFPFASNELFASKSVTDVAGIWCVRGGGEPSTFSADAQPAWSRELSTSGSDSCNSARFTCVLAGQAVVDHETGLMWTRNVRSVSAASWYFDSQFCLNFSIGGVSGWRLPTLPELMSLRDATHVSPAVSLPSGHPFTGSIAGGDQWWTTSISPVADDAGAVSFVGVNAGQAGSFVYLTKNSVANAWCVRGPGSQ